jgi:tetratricopeptide (TPR) repeat protein
VPVKDIAKRLFATPPTISSQLQNLREKGYVEASQRGREVLYEVSEPLMRICIEVKDNQSHEPLRLLVDFLRVWYDDRELSLRLSDLELAGALREYLESAIERNKVEGNLRRKLFLEDLLLALPSQTPLTIRHELLRECETAPEAVALALRYFAEGEPEKAISCLDEAIKDDFEPNERAILLLTRGHLHAIRHAEIEAIENFTAVVELPHAPVEQIARALVNRGITYGQTGETQQAVEDCAAVVNMPGTPQGVLVEAYFALSGIYFGEGRWNEGFSTLDEGLESAAEQPPYFVSAADLIGMVFSAGLCLEGRRAKVGQLFAIYKKHHVLTVLGEGVVEHIGRIYRAGKPFPSTDNLDQWSKAWELASVAVHEFRLSLRLLQTGIAFVKAGGKDSGILLDLTSPEREILKQAFGLAEAEGN